MHRALYCAALVLAVACTSTPEEPPQPPAPPAPVEPAAGKAPEPEHAPANGPKTWVGQWNGPEGTSLVIEAKPGAPRAYVLTITNGDGPKTFDGAAKEGTIGFTRDGVSETIKAGDGDATGMKWLAGKKNCLLVKEGEGWCRDDAAGGAAPADGSGARCTLKAIQRFLTAKGEADPERFELKELQCTGAFASAVSQPRDPMNGDPAIFVLKDTGGTWEIVGNGSELHGWCDEHKAELSPAECKQLLGRFSPN